MIKAIILLSLVAATFAAASCIVPDYTTYDAITGQEDCTAGTPLLEGGKCSLLVADKYLCFGEALKRVTITCGDGCMKVPPCINTQCTAPVAAPTGFTLDNACTGKMDNTKTCTVTNTDASYVLTKYNALTKKWSTLLPTITCNQGTWSHSFESHQMKKCPAIAATIGHSAGTEVAFGEAQTITATADYFCTSATSECSYDGNSNAVNCFRNSCPAAPANAGLKSTPECAGDKKTLKGQTCTATAKDGHVFLTTVTTKTTNLLTQLSTTVMASELKGSTYNYHCKDNSATLAPTGWVDFLNSDDGKGNTVEGRVSIIKSTCSAATATTAYTVKSSCTVDGPPGAPCVFEATALYTCTGTTSSCAYNNIFGEMKYTPPTCVLKVGCTVPKVEGVTITGCSAGVKVGPAATCTTAAKVGYTCTNTGVSTCGANNLFDKTPACDKPKGQTRVAACFRGSRTTTVTAPMSAKLQASAKTKIDAVVGVPKDYVVDTPSTIPSSNSAEFENAFTGDGSSKSTCITVTGLTVAQATVLVASFKTSTADYVTALDNAYCFYLFAELDMELVNKVPYPRIYVDGKIDIPIVSLGGSASITSTSSWFIGVLASFLFLGMTR